MSLETPPAFHSLAAYEYPARSVRRVVQSLAGSREGVFGYGPTTTELQVVPTVAPSMSVRVLAGKALINGDSVARQGAYFAENTATLTLGPFTVPGSGQTRTDLIVLEDLDSSPDGGSAGSDLQRVRVITGTVATDPTLPTTPATPANAIPLALITLKAAVTSITGGGNYGQSGRIVDLRPRVTPAGYIDRTWVPGLSGGGNAPWTFVASNPELVVAIPSPGWIECHLAGVWGFSTGANTRYARFVPLQHRTDSAGDLEALTSAPVADLEGAEGEFELGVTNDRAGAWEPLALFGHWYVPSARMLRLALQYGVSAENLYINGGSAPVLVRYTPDLAAA